MEQKGMMEEELRKEESERKINRIRYIIFILLFLVLLFFATFGITVSIYKGDSGENQEIITDKIIFSYSDVDKGGNGINIRNATPISDAQGKVLVGSGRYFDFSVTATSKNTNILYKLLIRKDQTSTLSNSNVRIYLVSLNENVERQLVLTDFNNLKQVKIDGVDYYVLYERTLDKGIDNYSDYYRLRMWVKEDAVDYEDKIFSLKVDVEAEQVGD